MSEPAQTDRVLTIPNVISLLRIALIPVVAVLIVDPDTTRAGRTSGCLTIPNVISLLRIALIPVFAVLIVDPDTTRAGLVVFVVVVATDWVDGALARATGQVSDLGK